MRRKQCCKYDFSIDKSLLCFSSLSIVFQKGLGTKSIYFILLLLIIWRQTIHLFDYYFRIFQEHVKFFKAMISSIPMLAIVFDRLRSSRTYDVDLLRRTYLELTTENELLD